MDGAGVIQSGDFELQSSHETPEEMRQALAVEEPTPPVELPAEPVATPEPATPDQGDRDPKTGKFAPKPAPKPREDPIARMKDATAKEAAAKRERDEAVRRAEAAERERDELRARSQRPEPQVSAPKPQVAPQGDPNDPEPDPENLQTYPDGQFDRKYLKDQARWEARQEYKAAEMARRRFAAEESRQRELDTHATQFSERLSAAETADPGFMDRVHPKLANAKPTSALGPNEQPTFANFLAEQVFRSEHPRELMLHLSDEKEVQRLATLPPMQVIRDLAIFEARLGAASPVAAPAPAAISHARDPIKPLGSSPSAGDTTAYSDDLSFEENLKRQNKREGRPMPRGL